MKYGLFEFIRVRFGLCNDSATFAQVVNLVLITLNWKIALSFLDDVPIRGATAEAHIGNPRLVVTLV
jgi:hypothetical protein